MATESRPFDVYGDESPAEIHTDDCDDTPESWPTGDANAEVVLDPESYAQDGETFDVSCACLDDVLGRDDRDRLIGAFDVAGNGFDPADDLDVDLADQSSRAAAQIATVTVPQGGSVTVHDDADSATPIGEALALHGWEVGTIRATDSGTAVSVWESGDEPPGAEIPISDGGRVDVQSLEPGDRIRIQGVGTTFEIDDVGDEDVELVTGGSVSVEKLQGVLDDSLAEVNGVSD